LIIMKIAEKANAGMNQNSGLRSNSYLLFQFFSEFRDAILICRLGTRFDLETEISGSEEYRS